MKNKVFILMILFSLLAAPRSASAARVDAPQAAGAPGSLSFRLLASGLTSPVAVTHAGDGSGRLFITQQSGQVLIHDGTQLLSTPFLDISSKVAYGGEQGLLSVAFHPEYETNGYFYVDYTRKSDGATVIARYSVSANPNVANTTETVLKIISQPYVNHNGGQLQFGPDGYLYIGMGDGGSGGDPDNYAQNPASLLGKILRIDVDGGSPYAIPPDNPFLGNPNVADEIWAFGVRNPWRFSFDRLTGDLFIADVGQNAWEEIDFQAAGSAGGQNYGWPCYEGAHDYDTGRTCTTYGTLTPPTLEYAHGPGDSIGCSVTGGYRYRGGQYPALDGLYLYGDFCTGRLWAAAHDGSSWTSNQVADTSYLIAAFGEDEAGELYLVDLNGAIYQIAASTFSDVPASHWAWAWIESLYAYGVTGGCSTTPPLAYCPDTYVTRDQMAVFLLRAKYGDSYTPPAASGLFADVPSNYWAADWIEQLYNEGVTGGCSTAPLLYCPDVTVTRDQMAVFLLRAGHGSTYTPPATAGLFEDVPAEYWAADWIEQLYNEGVTGGCSASPLQYCPTAPVTRDQMAVFLVKNFDLPPVSLQDYALRFHGHGTTDIDRVKIPLDAPAKAVDVGGDFTLEFWMKASAAENTSTACTGGGDNWINGNIIFDRDIYGSGDYGDYGVSLYGGKIAFGVANASTSNTLCGTTSVTDNAWHHIAVTRNSASGAMAIFVDGMLDASASGPTGDISYRNGRSTAYPNSDPFLVIGAEKHDAGAAYPSFSGWIDEVRISDLVRYTASFTAPTAKFSADAHTAALYHLDTGPEGACSGLVVDSSTLGPSHGFCNYGGAAPAGPLYSTDTPFTP